VARSRDKDKAGEAEAAAKAGLFQGIAKTKALITQYRARLAMLGRNSAAHSGEPPRLRPKPASN
jgi:hypothetical protein